MSNFSAFLTRGNKRVSSKNTRDLRPTTGLVKNAMFQILDTVVEMEGAPILDLYAGTGALGIEALKQGARYCEFVERVHHRCANIRSSLDIAGFNQTSHVLNMAVGKALNVLDDQFRIVFMDPPYEQGIPARILDLLGRNSLIEPNGWIILEHSSRLTTGDKYGKLMFWKTYRYGDTSVSLFFNSEEVY